MVKIILTYSDISFNDLLKIELNDFINKYENICKKNNLKTIIGFSDKSIININLVCTNIEKVQLEALSKYESFFNSNYKKFIEYGILPNEKQNK